MSKNGLASFENAKYINLTTFRKNGKAVPTAVWFVVHNNLLYIGTGGQTGKAKRIRANGRAQVAPSDARGNAQRDLVPAVGRQVNDANMTGTIQAALRKKYGLQYRAMNMMSPLRRNRIGDQVVIELELNPNGSQ